MPTPICAKCSSSKYLCSVCQGRYDAGQITAYDIEVSRMLYGLLGEKASFRKIVDTSDHLVLVTDGESVGDIIGLQGSTIRKIEEILGRKFKVVGEGDVMDVAQALIAPAKVKHINPVYLQGAMDKVRVHVEKQDKGRLRHSEEDLAKMISYATDKRIELVFD
jgi:transcription antitermination factor NusA-like protein